MTVDVQWDVAALTRQFIADNWGNHPRTTGVAAPDHVELYSEDADGNPRKGVDYTNEYVLVTETGDRGQEYVDGPRDVVDPSASCNLEASTPVSRARREEMWGELLALAEYARKRSEGTPGNWDTVSIDGAPVDDETFGWWSLEVTWAYSAEARTL